MTDRRLVDGVASELILVGLHKKQVLKLIQNLRPLLLGSDDSHVLRHCEALDVLLLLENHGYGGGSFAILSGNFYDLLAFLVLSYNLLHFEGYGHLFRDRLCM